MTTEYRHALPMGTRIGEYRIERVLGSGGFGITYLAVDENLGARVAIKEYLPTDLAVRVHDMSVQARSAGDDPTFAWGLERFRDEAQMLARFDHPNIVRVLRYLEANHTAYMVMHYVDGESLRDLLTRRGQMTEPEVQALLAPLLDGLTLVHRAGVLHRDIKPGNIYVRGDGAPVLLDFGAARQAMGERSRSMTTVLTPPYAPYEQYTKTLPQGPWTDLYAMAVVVYESLSGGHKPPDATDRIVGTDPLVPLSEIVRLSPAMAAAVAAGLQVDGAKRPQSADQWRALLLPREHPPPKPPDPPPPAPPGLPASEAAEPMAAALPDGHAAPPDTVRRVFATLSLLGLPGLWLLIWGLDPQTDGQYAAVGGVSLGLLLILVLSADNAIKLKAAGMGRRLRYYAGGILVALATWVGLFIVAVMVLESLPIFSSHDESGILMALIVAACPAFAAFHFLWRRWKRAAGPEPAVGPQDDAPSPSRPIVPILIVAVVLVSIIAPLIASKNRADRLEEQQAAEQDRQRDEERRRQEAEAATRPVVDAVSAKAKAAQNRARDAQEKARNAQVKAAKAGTGISDGYGVIAYDSGERYEGHLVNGDLDGFGVYTWPDGDRYEGQFRGTTFDGAGVFSYANGGRYEGGWRKNDKTGFGVTSASSQTTQYMGKYAKNQRNGAGVEFDGTGAVLRAGLWADDDFQRPFTSDDVP